MVLIHYSVLFALLLHIAVAFDKRLEERVNLLQDHFKTITRHVLPKMEDHLEWVENNEDFILSVENNEFQAQETMRHAMWEMARRMASMEEQQQQCSCVSFACPSGYVEVSGKCLFFYNSTSFYDEAKNKCSQVGGQLAIIDNCNLLHGIASLLGNDALIDSDARGYWVGATDAKKEGKWAWSDGRDVQMRPTFWGRQISEGEYEPNGGVAENCLLMKTGYNYRFGDSNCDGYIGKSPLCQYNDDTCSSPRVRLEGRCLEFQNGLEVNWSGAGAKCVENGGKLAKVDDCNFMGAIMGYLLNTGLTPTEGYWVGGGDSTEEGTWLWQDGTPVPMGAPYWDQTTRNTRTEPNGGGSRNCGALRGNTRWMLDDHSCGGQPNKAICEAPHIIAAKSQFT